MDVELLGRVCRALEQHDITYMISGSVAGAHHSVPRATRDIDIVVDADVTQIEMFVDEFDEENFYIDDAVVAVRSLSMFNVIDLRSGWKVDVIIRKNRDFSHVELGRREAASILGVDVFVATAEDTVLAKLEWWMKSDSDRQRDDVVAIIEAQGGNLDDEYLAIWAERLGVADRLAQARARSRW